MLSDSLLDQGVSLSELMSSGDPCVSIVEGRYRFSIRANAKDRTEIAKALGLTLPNSIGQTASKDDVITACLGPDEWMVMTSISKGQNLLKKMEIQSVTHRFSVVDVSHRNVRFKIHGAKSRGTVNVGCPLDLSLPAFPVGKCCRSVYEAAPILLHRVGEDEFHIECWRSFAPYVAALMERHIIGLQTVVA